MQYRNIQIMSLILLLIISSIGLIQENDDPKIETEESSLQLNDNYLDQSDEKMISNSRAASLSRQNKAYGGSWLDSFEDDSKIDWGMSSYCNYINEDIKVQLQPLKVDTNTLGLWHFDENTGTTSDDKSANNNDIMLGGNGIGPDLPAWTSGKFGKALYYDGVNDFAYFTGDTDGVRTIELWFCPKIDISSSLSEPKGLLKRNGNPPTTIEFGFNFIPSTGQHKGELGFGNSESSAAVYSGINYWNANVWHHAAVTIDPIAGTKEYIDGILTDSVTATGPINDFDGITALGRWGDTSIRLFNGIIDEVRISDIARVQPKCQAYLTSKSINLPSNMYWDTIFINKTEPGMSYINITVLNASNNQPIPGSLEYTEDGEFDISYIDPVKYPTIKLNATLVGSSWGIIPTLHSWGVSWNASNSWQDMFFGGVKVESDNNINVIDGNAQAIRIQTELEVDVNTVALWHFNEGSGTTTNDETNNNIDGTLGVDGLGTDLPTWTNGKFGYALDFDGSDDYVKTTSGTTLPVGNSARTVEFHMFSRSIPTDLQSLVGYGSGTQGAGKLFMVTLGNIQSKIFLWSNTNNFQGNQLIEQNKWHSIAVSYDGSIIRIYVNGQLDSYGVKSINTYDSVNSKKVRFGFEDDSGSYSHFDGIIDEIRISNIARSAQEIKDHYLGNGFENYSILESNPIVKPDNSNYNRLLINKTESIGNYLNITILDGQTDIPIQNFEDLSGTDIDISSIDPKVHPSIKLKGTFESNGESTSVLHGWSVNWTANTPPKILGISSPTEIYRTRSAIISVNLSDIEEVEANLTLQAKYKSPSDVNWQTDFLSAPSYNYDHWECNFTPTLSAELGWYSFNFTCNDSYQFFAGMVESDLIKVVNFKATVPEVIISPSNPMTFQDITVIAKNSTDGETAAGQLEYWYRWYKDDVYLPVFENLTFIPETSTLKNETWRCVVIPFDLEEPGNPGEAEIIIMNTPPFLVEEFNYFTLVEDSSVILEDKLTSIFREVDDDNIEFTASGQNNISVNIIQENGTISLTPKENWFGAEYVTFYANDSYTTFDENIIVKYENQSFQIKSQETVMIEVLAANDLPSILQVGNQMTEEGYPELGYIANQGDWLNLTIIVDDIDLQNTITGIQYSMNLTNSDNLYLKDNTIYFNPQNKDVGWHYIKIFISDGNETPLEYITQDLKINVLNVNDPPTVQIITPTNDQEFNKTDPISFSCQVNDLDLYLENSNEKLTFQWITNNSEFAELGNEQNLSDISSLKPGYYNITVEVTDSSNAKVTDYVHILIKDQKTVNSDGGDGDGGDGDGGGGLLSADASSNFFMWLVLIIVIIIIILIIVFFVIMNKKKKRRFEEKMGIPEQELLHPVGATPPSTIGSPTVAEGLSTQPPQPQPQAAIQSTPISSTPPQELLGATPTAQPQQPAQLPPVQLPVPQSEKTGEPELTLQQKIGLLEKRLLQGEISEETFLNLKDKYELETKPFQPAPQLPPGRADAITEPTPTTPVEPIQPEQPPPMAVPLAPTQLQAEIPPEQEIMPQTPSDLPADAYQVPPEAEDKVTLIPYFSLDSGPKPVQKEAVEHEVTEDVVVADHDLEKATSDLQSATTVKPTEEGAVFHDGDKNVWKPDVRGKTSENKEVLEQVEKLGELRATGIITEEEFQRKKAELL